MFLIYYYYYYYYYYGCPLQKFDQHASLFLGLPSVNIILIGVLGEEAYIQGMQSVGH